MINNLFFLKPLTKAKLLALALIIIATALWGFGFIATKWALSAFNVSLLIFLRFFFSALLGGILWKLFSKVSLLQFRSHLALSFWPGLWMALMILFQTWGLKTTSASQSAFITVLYVVLVPVLELLMYKKKLHVSFALVIALAVFGLSLITNVDFKALVLGDLLTLVCAVFAAAHILAVDKCSQSIARREHSAWGINTCQCAWAAAWLAPLLLLDHPQWTFSSLAVTGLVMLVVLVTLLAFYLQFIAQEKISPSVSAVLFLLESPFSAFFAFFLLNETLQKNQLLGAGLILISCVWAVLLSPGAKPLETKR